MNDDIHIRFPDIRETGETTLRQCQLVMIRMLKILDYICTQHGIGYWMTAGTLIGAIRHRGFIPWDCDVDLGMSIPDYQRLKALRHLLPGDIFFQDSETDPTYPSHTIASLRDRYSNYYEWQAEHPTATWHNGLQVDLLLYTENKHGYLVNPIRGTEYVPSEIFPLSRLTFEGTPLCAPRFYDAYLRCRYGDYMQLPPPEHRVAREGRADPFTPCEHIESRPYPRAQRQT